MTSPIERLLDRLNTPRRAGAGWVARCPAHQDRNASLSLAEGNGGTVLLHCFADCPAADVVAAVGFTLADLFERPPASHRLNPAQRRALNRETRIARQWAALGAALPELAVIEVAAGLVVARRGLRVDDHARVVTAHDHIHRLRLDVREAIA